MNRMLKKNRIKMNDSGAAIVMTIVAVAIISILAILALWIAYMNYYMKVTDRNATVNFYSAEGIVEQIRVGLQEKLSDASTVAYHEVMQNFTTPDVARTGFINKVKTELDTSLGKTTDGDGDDIYDVKTLCKFVEMDDATDLDSPLTADGFTYEFTVNSGKDTVTIAASDDGEKESNSKPLLEKDDTINAYIVRNVNVTYTNSLGYTSVINTDFSVRVPNLNFNATTTPSTTEMLEYCVIADDNLVGEPLSNATLKGAVYGGDGEEKAVYTDPDTDYTNAGIYLGDKTVGGASMTFEPNDFASTKQSVGGMDKTAVDYVISGKPVRVNGVDSKLDVGLNSGRGIELWAQDLYLEGNTDELNLNTRSTANIRDDLSIDGDECDVKILGEYVGYGRGWTSTGDEDDGSSAILINGKRTNLDIGNSMGIMVAGTSYVATKDAKKSLPAASRFETEFYANIPMSDSIAVRGNQVAYLVPDKAMPGSVNSNPVTAFAYENEAESYVATNPGTFGVKMDYELEWKNGTDTLTISDYCSKIQRIFVQGLGGNYLVYYYMVMDQDSAADFFERYYGISKNKTKLEKFLGKYVSDVNDELNVTDWSNITMKGNALLSKANAAAADPTVEKSEIKSATAAADLASNEYYIRSADYGIKNFPNLIGTLNEQKSPDLDTEYVGAPGETRNKRVYDYIINTEKVNQVLNIKGADCASLDNAGTIGIISRENVKISGGFVTGPGLNKSKNSVRCIICSKDVRVEDDFKGCIIADGKVYISNGANVNLEADNDDSVMKAKWTSTGGTTFEYGEFFNGYEKTDTDTPTGKEETDLDKLVRYENWTKR